MFSSIIITMKISEVVCVWNKSWTRQIEMIFKMTPLKKGWPNRIYASLTRMYRPEGQDGRVLARALASCVSARANSRAQEFIVMTFLLWAPSKTSSEAKGKFKKIVNENVKEWTDNINMGPCIKRGHYLTKLAEILVQMTLIKAVNARSYGNNKTLGKI